MSPAICILCGDPAASFGVFHPDRPADFGVGTPPPGKARVCVYGLCSKHDFRRRSVVLLIEEEIARMGQERRRL